MDHYFCNLLGAPPIGPRAVVPNLGGIPPRGEFAHLWGGGGNEQLSKTIQHLFGLKIHLIYNYKASDSLNFHEIKFN